MLAPHTAVLAPHTAVLAFHTAVLAPHTGVLAVPMPHHREVLTLRELLRNAQLSVRDDESVRQVLDRLPR